MSSRPIRISLLIEILIEELTEQGRPIPGRCLHVVPVRGSAATGANFWIRGVVGCPCQDPVGNGIAHFHREDQHAWPGNGIQSRAHIRHITEIRISQIDKRCLHCHYVGTGGFHNVIRGELAEERVTKNLSDALQIVFRNRARLRKENAHVLATQLTVLAEICIGCDIGCFDVGVPGALEGLRGHRRAAGNDCSAEDYAIEFVKYKGHEGFPAPAFSFVPSAVYRNEGSA